MFLTFGLDLDMASKHSVKDDVGPPATQSLEDSSDKDARRNCS